MLSFSSGAASIQWTPRTALRQSLMMFMGIEGNFFAIGALRGMILNPRLALLKISPFAASMGPAVAMLMAFMSFVVIFCFVMRVAMRSITWLLTAVALVFVVSCLIFFMFFKLSIGAIATRTDVPPISTPTKY